jgi:hypothetical protein
MERFRSAVRRLEVNIPFFRSAIGLVRRFVGNAAPLKSLEN